MFNQFLFLFIQKPNSDLAKDVDQVSEGFKNSWARMWDRISDWKDTIILHLPEVILALFAFSICYILSIYVKGWVSKPLRRLIKKTSIRSLVANLISILVILIGLIIAIGVLNLNDVLHTILAGAGIAGLAVGLALQSTLANTFSGIFLSVNDVINVGDWIETNGFTGNVEEITLRNTRIREADNNIVVIPNKTIAENPFKNYALTPRIRTTIKCGVHYSSNLREVKDMAVNAIAERFPQMDYEHVEFHYLEFADSSINFQIRFWIEASSYLTILESNSEAMMILKEVFDENNISIPFPIRTLEFGGTAQDKDFLNSILKGEN